MQTGRFPDEQRAHLTAADLVDLQAFKKLYGFNGEMLKMLGRICSLMDSYHGVETRDVDHLPMRKPEELEPL